MTTMTKRRRFEARLDDETGDLLTRAADTLGVKFTPFVIGAARREAERVLARADVVMFSDEEFDAMIAALAGPPKVLPGIAKIAAQPRLFERA